MATQYTIEMLFKGVDEVGSTIDSIVGKYNSFDSKVQGVADPFADLAETALKVDTALAALALGGLTLSYSKALEFGSAMSGLKKVLDPDEFTEITKHKNEIIELSDYYGIASTNVTESATTWKQAGYGINEAMKLTKSSIDLVVAGDMEAGRATESLTAIMKGFRLEAADSRTVVDSLNEVSNNYATNTEQLAIAVGDLAPVARLAGYTFQETTGLVTPIIEVFRSGSEAAMALKSGLLRLQSDVDPVQAALSKLGISQKDANGELKTAKQILTELTPVFGKLSDSQKTYYAQELIGIDQGARMLEVLTQQNKIMDITATAYNSVGSAAKEVNVKLETSEYILKRFTTGLNNLFIAIGEEIQGPVDNVIKGATDIENAFRDLLSSGAFDDLIDIINRQSERIEALFKDIAAALPDAFDDVDFSPIEDAIDTVLEELQSVTGIDLSDLITAEGLEDTIQRAVNGIGSLGNVTAGIISVFKPVIAIIKRLGDESDTMSADTKRAFGEVLGSALMITKAGTAIASAFIAIKQSGSDANQVFDVITGSLRTVYNAIQNVYDLWTTFIASFVGSAAEDIAGILDFVGLDDASAALKDLKQNMDNLSEAAKDNYFENYEQMLAAAGDTAAAFRGELGETTDAINGLPDSKSVSIELEQAGMSMDDLVAALSTLPEYKDIDIKANLPEIISKAKEAGIAIEDIPTFTQLGFEASVDGMRALEEHTVLMAELEKNGVLVIEPTVDKAALGKAAADVKKALPDEYEYKYSPYYDTRDVEYARGYLEDVLPGGSLSFTWVGEVDKPALKKAAKDIEKAVPNEKILKIETDLQIAELKASSEQLESMLKYKAEVETAEAEAAAERIKSAFESVNTGIDSTGGLIESLFGDLGDYMGSSVNETQARWQIQEQLEKENALRERTVSLQEKLTKAQVEYMKARTERLNSGDAMVNVNADQLAVPLTMLFREVIALCQIEANQEGLEVLIGL